MAAKMTVYYKKNIRKSFLRLCMLSRSSATDSILLLFSSLCFSWPSFFSGLLISAESSSLLQIWRLRPQILSVSGLSVNPIMPRLPCPYLMKVVSINMSRQIAFHTPGICLMTCSLCIKCFRQGSYRILTVVFQNFPGQNYFFFQTFRGTSFISVNKQDAQLSQRDRAAGCVTVFTKSRRLELGDNILQTL